MDDLDKQIISLLAANARMPVAVMAKKLGVARSTVQTRLERLEVSGVIAGYTLRLGEKTRASRVYATALISVEPRSYPGILQRLKTMPEITHASTTTGRFDMILTLSTASTEDLDRVLDAIGQFTGVRSSESLVHLSKKIDRGI